MIRNILSLFALLELSISPAWAQQAPAPTLPLSGNEVLTCYQGGYPKSCTTGNISDITPGTVTSVGVGNISGLTTAGAPVTTTGSVSQTLNSQTANTVFAAPSGSAGAPSFRALNATDIAGITIPIANGGTNATTAASAFTNIAGTYLPGASASVQGTGIPGLDNLTSGWSLYTNPTSNASNNPLDTLRVQRYANYVGGTPGFVNSGFHVYHTVAAGVANYEWSILGALDNSATGGENTAIYGQAFKRAGAGPTWASTFEARDKNDTADPTTALVASEMDIFGNGTDVNRAKIGLNVVCGRDNLSGATQICGRGLWFSSANGDTAGTAYSRVIEVSSPYGYALDTTAGGEQQATIMMAPTQKIAFDGATNGNFNRYLFYSSGALYYHTASGNVFSLADNGTATGSAIFSAPTHMAAGSPPAGSGTCAINTQIGGNTAGAFKANGACAGGTVILTFANAASNGYVCTAQDMTTTADTLKQTAYTTTTVTFTATLANLDTVVFSCMGF